MIEKFVSIDRAIEISIPMVFVEDLLIRNEQRNFFNRL